MPSVGSLFKNAVEAIESLTDNHKNPLHVGEAMACWTYLAFASEIVVYIEIGLNTTTDTELKNLYQDGYHLVTSHRSELSEFMKQEGVPLPEIPESKPQSDPNEIPLGVKFTDRQLANTISINFIVAADMCATSASQCLRTDTALMFLKFQTEKLSLGLKAKELMQKKGWLKVPPFYIPPGLPTQNKG